MTLLPTLYLVNTYNPNWREMVTDTAPRGRPLRGAAPMGTSQSATMNTYGQGGYAPPRYQQQQGQSNMQQAYRPTSPSSNASYGNNPMASPGNYGQPSQEFSAFGNSRPASPSYSGYRAASPTGDMTQPWQQGASNQASPRSMPSRVSMSTQSLMTKMNSNLSMESEDENRADRYGAMGLGQTEEERDQPPVYYGADAHTPKSPAIAMLLSNDSSVVEDKDRYGNMTAGLNSLNSQQQRHQGGYSSRAQQQQQQQRFFQDEAKQQQRGAYGDQSQQHQVHASRNNEAMTDTNSAMMSGYAQQSPQQPSGYGMPRRVGVQQYSNYGSAGAMPPLPEQQQVDMSHKQMQPEGHPRPYSPNQMGGPSPMGYYGQSNMATQQQEQQQQLGMMQPMTNGPYPNHGMGYNNTSPRRTFAA